MTKPIMSIKILEDFATYTNAADDWITEYVPEAWEAREVLDYIAELEAKNERYIKLIQDWVDVLDPRYPQGDGLASAVRQAMLEINKECEK